MRRVKWFCLLEGAIYAAFLYLDLFRPDSCWDVPLKYAGILLCVALAFSLARDSDGRLMCAALSLTALADLFLLVLDLHYLLGVSCFCAVQILYLIRIRRLRDGALWPELLLRAALTAAALVIAAGLGVLEPLTALSLFYFVQLAVNAALSFRLGRRYLCFSLGLCLFIGCDLCVGLHDLSLFLSGAGTGPLFSFARVGMWLFYLPSQVLLTLSIRSGDQDARS